MSPPSHVNGPIFLYLFIYIYVTGTAHIVMLYVLLILRAHSPLAKHSTSNYDPAFHTHDTIIILNSRHWSCSGTCAVLGFQTTSDAILSSDVPASADSQTPVRDPRKARLEWPVEAKEQHDAYQERLKFCIPNTQHSTQYALTFSI